MFEMFPVLVNDKFYQGFIYLGILLIILLEEYFMFNLSWELHFDIIVCFALIIYV